jgi:hypothetical protein
MIMVKINLIVDGLEDLCRHYRGQVWIVLEVSDLLGHAIQTSWHACTCLHMTCTDN